MSLDEVTVIIANHNYEQFLVGAVESAATEKPGLIVVVDDGSTDESVRTLISRMENAAQDEIMQIPFVSGTINGVKVNLFSAHQSQGPSAARNVAMKVSWDQTKYFAILDADDRFLPGRLGACVDLLEKYGEVAGAVYTDYFQVRGGIRFRHCKKAFVKRELLFDNMVHSACVIRKSVLEESGMYDESMRLGEDYDLWMRIAKSRIILHLPDAMMNVNEGEWQVSRRATSDSWAKSVQILRDRHCQSLLS